MEATNHVSSAPPRRLSRDRPDVLSLPQDPDPTTPTSDPPKETTCTDS